MIQVAIKSGRLAKILVEHLPDLQILPSKTLTEDFPDGKITIRPERWDIQNMDNPDHGMPLSVRLTYKDKSVKPHHYEYTRKVHFDLAYCPTDKEWTLLPCLGQGRIQIDLFENIVNQIKLVAMVIKTVAQKGS
jgi:hypothetical protein